MAEGSDPYYRDFAAAYDEYSRGVPGDIEFYVELARAAGRVVELGVGTGRVAVPTAEAGVSVLGIDLEPAMLAIARAKADAAGVGERLTLRAGDMRTFELDAPAPLVTIPFRTFLHNLTSADQLATLAACRRALEPGGRLALNVFNPNLQLMARWMERGSTHWEPFGGWEGYEARHDYGTTEQVVTTSLRIRNASGGWRKTSFRLRYVHRHEMQHLLERAGFEVETIAGGFAGEPLEDSSPEMVWIARRAGRQGGGT
ncbi:MAG: class I SAM-dependent methyltransferase [Dehalococcoidia bacterium]